MDNEEQDLVMDVEIIEDEGTYIPGETLGGSVVEEEVLFDIPNHQEEGVQTDNGQGTDSGTPETKCSSNLTNHVTQSTSPGGSIPQGLGTGDEAKGEKRIIIQVLNHQSPILQPLFPLGDNILTPVITPYTLAYPVTQGMLQTPPQVPRSISPTPISPIVPTTPLSAPKPRPLPNTTPLTESKEGVVDLAGGWKKKIVQRKNGNTAGRYDIYLFSPEGVKLRSRVEVINHLQKTNSTMNINEIDFSKPDSMASPRKKRPLSDGDTSLSKSKKKKLNGSIVDSPSAQPSLDLEEFIAYAAKNKKAPECFFVPINGAAKKNGILDSSDTKIHVTDIKPTTSQSLKKTVLPNLANCLSQARKKMPFLDRSLNIEINNGRSPHDIDLLDDIDEEEMKFKPEINQVKYESPVPKTPPPPSPTVSETDTNSNSSENDQSLPLSEDGGCLVVIE